MIHAFGDSPSRAEPKIRYALREFEDVDAPDLIRWRAFWDKEPSSNRYAGIFLQCFPVVRKTHYGAWIDPEAYRCLTRQPWQEGALANEWVLSNARHHKLVYDGSGSAWAKPTRAEALRSLGIRLMRWSAAVRRDVDRVNDACEVAEVLLTGSVPGAGVFSPHANADLYGVRKYKIIVVE